MTRRPSLTIAIALALVACGGEEEGHEGHGEAGHEAHEARRGGTLVEFGDHEGHVEVKHDDAAGKVSIWVYDAEMNELALDGAPVLNFTGPDGPCQVEGKGEGAAWTFEHEDLKGEPGNARFKLVAGGRPYTPSWEH